MTLDQKPVVIFTTMHNANDHRIYYKEARSLSKKYPVIIVAPLRGNGRITEVHHKRISFISNRLFRFVTNIRHIPTVWRLNPRVVHIHDPELLTIALILKLFTRAKIIYDAHENQHIDILQKEWLPVMLRKLILFIYKSVEYIVLKNADGLILAEDSYLETYNKFKNTEIIRNYPVTEMHATPKAVDRKTFDVIRLGYIGSVQRIRGTLEMLHLVSCIKHIHRRDVRLDVIGAFENEKLEREALPLVESLNIEACVRFTGFLPHESAVKLLAEVHIGLALFHPLPTHQRILPVKLYEYMLMHKPVIATDIALWHSVLARHKCGIFVDPFDAENTAKTVLSLYEDPNTIEEMGKNGYSAVVQEYNWATQEKLLYRFYEQVIGKN